MLKQENDTGKRALEICRKNHFDPVITFEMDQQMTSYNVTCSGMGISFIGDIMITKVTPNPNVVYYKLPLKDNCRNICFYWKKRPLSQPGHGRIFKDVYSEQQLTPL